MPARRAGIVLLAMLGVLAGCATRAAGPPPLASYVLVRHAEKAADDPRDPSLSDAGRARVERLVRRLHGTPLAAVYSTPFRRTQQTAAAVAADHALPVTIYDAAQPAGRTADALRRAHPAGTVLVVGHSNTIPALAEALCGCEIAPTGDAEYGRRITIGILPDGRVAVDDRREP